MCIAVHMRHAAKATRERLHAQLEIQTVKKLSREITVHADQRHVA